MTFRVDDLFVAVLPERLEAAEGCKGCTVRTGGDTPCASDDPHTHNCLNWPCNNTCENNTDCDDTQEVPCPPTEKKKKNEAWRDEQFAALSRELEEALAE